MKRLLTLLVFALGLAGLMWLSRSLLGDEALVPDPVLEGAKGDAGGEPDPQLAGPALESADRGGAREAATASKEAGEADAAASTGSLLLRTARADGTPVPEVVVFVTPKVFPRLGHGTSEWTTDATGVARIGDLLPGEVSLFSPLGPRERVTVVAGVETEVLLAFRGGVDVQGIVRDPAGGPVEGADVWVVSWRRDWLGTQLAARTGPGGEFTVWVQADKSLGATAEGFAPSELVDLELVDTETSPVAVELALQAGGGGLEGAVTDPEGRPVPGARVAVGSSPKDYSSRNDGTNEERWCARVTTTDESGAFAFTGLAAGAQPLHVVAPEYPEYADEVEIPAGGRAHAEVRLARGMTVSGVARDDLGEVVPGAIVLALDEPFIDPFPSQGPTEKGVPFHRPATRTDGAGAFRLECLPPGDVHLYASRGTTYWDDGNFLGTVQETLSGAAGAELEWNPVLSRGLSIRGLVQYANGAPMENVFVSAIDSDGRRYTEYAQGEGRFSIPGLENRAYEVSVQLWDAPDDARPVGQKDVWPSEAELVLTAGYSKLAREKGTVHARIDDRADRVHGRGAIVFAHDRGTYYSEEKDGVFSTTLPPDRYQARVMNGDDVVGAGEWFDLGPGEELDLGAIPTRRSGTLVVRVERPAELADNAVSVRVETDGARNPRRRGLPPGEDELSFEGLLEGPAKVLLRGRNVANETRNVEVLGDTPTTVEMVLQPAALVSVQVDAADPEGFGRLEIVLERAGGERYADLELFERWGTKLPADAGFYAPLGEFTVRATTTSGLSASGELVVESLAEDHAVTLTLE